MTLAPAGTDIVDASEIKKGGESSNLEKPTSTMDGAVQDPESNDNDKPTSNQVDQQEDNAEKQDTTDDAPREYVVEKIMNHRGKPDRRQYRVRWYGFDSADETWEPSEHIPEHFINGYWRRRRNAEAKSVRPTS